MLVGAWRKDFDAAQDKAAAVEQALQQRGEHFFDQADRIRWLGERQTLEGSVVPCTTIREILSRLSSRDSCPLTLTLIELGRSPTDIPVQLLASR